MIPVASLRPALGYLAVLVAFVGTPLLLIAEAVWSCQLAAAAFQADFGPGTPSPLRDPGLAGRLVADVRQGWFLLALTLVLLAVNRFRPAVWPGLTLVLTVPLLAGNIVGLPVGAERVGGLAGDLVGNPILPGGVTVLLGYGLAWLGARWLTTPLTETVARTCRELTVRLRGGGRLRLERDRLVLDPVRTPAAPDRPARLAIPWSGLAVLESGSVCTPDGRTEYTLPNGVAVDLPDGPALRVIGGGQQWVVPVTDADAVTTALRIRAVSPTARPATPPIPASRRESSVSEKGSQNSTFHSQKVVQVTLARWREVRELVAVEHRRQRHNPLRGLFTERHDFFLILGVLWLVLTGLSLPGLVEPWQPVYLIATAVFGACAVLALRRWRTLAEGRALLEANPSQPGTPPPTTDPARPPVPGWTTGRTYFTGDLA